MFARFELPVIDDDPVVFDGLPEWLVPGLGSAMSTGQSETRAGSRHRLNRRWLQNQQPYCPRRGRDCGAAKRRSACSLVMVFFLSSVKISTIQFEPLSPR